MTKSRGGVWSHTSRWINPSACLPRITSLKLSSTGATSIGPSLTSNWDSVRKKFMGVFWKVLKDNPGPYTQCDDTGWFHGLIKLITWSNERSALLLQQAIDRLKGLWNGANLYVNSIEENPQWPTTNDILTSPLTIWWWPRFPTPMGLSEGSLSSWTLCHHFARAVEKSTMDLNTISVQIYRGNEKKHAVQDENEPTVEAM